MNIFKLLQNIASGSALGRQDGCLCLMTAASHPCPFADRDSCIGCGYEILTKAVMHTLIKEYARLCNIKNNSEPTDALRHRLILENAVMPAVAEILSAIKMLCPDADTSELLDIMEEGIGYADSDTRRDERKLQPFDAGLGGGR